MLTEEKKKFYKALLTERLQQLLENGKKTFYVTNGSPEKHPDPADRATEELEKDFNFKMREREGGLIGKIEDALERIDDGTYGICEECEEDIAEGRLEARPVTTLCIECKKRQEAEERLRGF